MCTVPCLRCAAHAEVEATTQVVISVSYDTVFFNDYIAVLDDWTPADTGRG